MPFYGLPSINLGNRQENRSDAKSIINVSEIKLDILSAIEQTRNIKIEKIREFGEGNSDQLFLKTIDNPNFWSIDKQKRFVDIKNES
jgi:UDP-N-acetylglucosamine 2-epimerase (hydrolysing)